MMPQATQTIPRRPLIGVTGGLNEKGFLNIRNGYMQSVVRAGGIPVLLPLDAPEEILRDAFERMDGVLISAGQISILRSTVRKRCRNAER